MKGAYFPNTLLQYIFKYHCLAYLLHYIFHQSYNLFWISKRKTLNWIFKYHDLTPTIILNEKTTKQLKKTKQLKQNIFKSLGNYGFSQTEKQNTSRNCFWAVNEFPKKASLQMFTLVLNMPFISNANQLTSFYLMQIFRENFFQAGYWNLDFNSNNSNNSY